MTPIEFEGQTLILQKPPNMTDEQCSPLPILRLDGTCISCWQMTWKERLKAFWTGRVWLGILSGMTQPPVYVAIDRPFDIQSCFIRLPWGWLFFKPQPQDREMGIPRYVGGGYKQRWWRLFRKEDNR